METILGYFEKCVKKEKEEGKTKSKILKELGLKPSAMAMYEAGSIAKDEPIVKLAIKLKIEPFELLALAGFERAKNQETKKIWKKKYEEEVQKRPIGEKIRISQEKKEEDNENKRIKEEEEEKSEKD